MNETAIQKQVKTICDHYANINFEPEDNQTITEEFIKNLQICFKHNEITVCKIDFLGTATICDGESVAIYLDIIWLENQQIYTNPVRLESV